MVHHKVTLEYWNPQESAVICGESARFPCRTITGIFPHISTSQYYNIDLKVTSGCSIIKKMCRKMSDNTRKCRLTWSGGFRRSFTTLHKLMVCGFFLFGLACCWCDRFVKNTAARCYYKVYSMGMVRRRVFDTELDTDSGIHVWQPRRRLALLKWD